MKRIIYISLFIFLILSVGNLYSQETEIAITIHTEGLSEFRRTGLDWSGMQFGTVINGGDGIRTGANGFAALAFTDDGSQLRIRPNCQVTMSATRDEEESLDKRIILYVGEVLINAQAMKGSMVINSPTGVATVKGTVFWVLVTEEGTTQIITIEGIVELLNRATGETVDVPAGSYGILETDGSIETGDIEDTNIPEYPDEEENIQTIELDFMDEEGNNRSVIIELENETE